MTEVIANVSVNSSGTRLMMVPPPPGGANPQRRKADQPNDPTAGTKGRLRLRLAPGEIIPGTSWRITRWLGEGNMGVVYEARHVEINRRAAIKVVVAPLEEDSNAVEDFRKEASASATIGSPNIVDVFDFAVLGDGRLMMAMEFVPGRSLHNIRIADGQLAPSRLIGLMRQVCRGLQAAHEAGLVHRDIKPENIMVGVIAGRRDSVKIVDFGIATMLGERTLNRAGTPYYMAPEGLFDGAIDGRYDIYSLGCVMFEMLTGKPPFVAPTLERVLEMHQYELVPELTASDPDVTDALIAVIRRCLAKEPSERFASMADLEAALCEAQIEGKLVTLWDDLPLPAVDFARRANLLNKMPNRAPRKGVSGWWLPILLAFGVVVGGAIAWPMLRSDVAVAGNQSEVQSLVDRVHQSAALAYYVYPPVDDPQADTAYRVLAQLEELDTHESTVAAKTLRTALAEALVRLGDDIWDKPGGESFALDFYIQAIMFDRAIEPARTRVAMSPGELLALRRKARAGDFTEIELIAVEPLLALAEPNEVTQNSRLETIKTSRRGRRGGSATAQLDTLIATRVVAPPKGTDAQLAAIAEAAPAPAPEYEVETGQPSHRKGAADKLVAKATGARKAARLQEAETLYHKALRVEQHRVDALTGLGRVYFEQANYSKSVIYYEMAVRRSARNAELRIALGDAHLKILDYARALAQYEKAKALGSSKADKRIARIEHRTGG